MYDESFPLESSYLGELSISLHTFPLQNVNWPAACLVCLCGDAIVLHVDCIFTQLQSANRIHQDNMCDCSLLTSIADSISRQPFTFCSAVKSAIINIFILIMGQTTEGLLVVTTPQRIITWPWSSPTEQFSVFQLDVLIFWPATLLSPFFISVTFGLQQAAVCCHSLYTTCSAPDCRQMQEATSRWT